jgi:uncharacterized coiled-coil DUF342 family protein
MKIQTWVKPLIASIGALIMCALLSACQSSKANVAKDDKGNKLDSKSYSSEITIKTQDNLEGKSFYVEGKKYHWFELTTEQQDKVLKIEKELEILADSLSIDEEKLELWGNKVAAISDELASNVEKLEEINVKLDKDTITFGDLGQISKELVGKSEQLQLNMRGYAEKMKLLQANKPYFDESKVKRIEAKARELKEYFGQIAATR